MPTQLKRKNLRKKMEPQKAVLNIKRLSARPVIKNVDVQAIKEEFRKQKEAAK